LEARGAEQALILLYRLERLGGTLMNRINSIAPARPEYFPLVETGKQFLEKTGYNFGPKLVP
jgi:hypothetical protein